MYIVFFDLDETLIDCQSQKLLVKYLFKHRKIKVTFLLLIYLWFFLYRLRIVKDVAKIREYAYKICKGWDINEAKKFYMNFFEEMIKFNFYQDALKEIINHKKNKARIVLLTSTLFPIAEIICNYLKLDDVIATRLVIEDGKYTGKINGLIVYGVNKKIIINDYLKNNHYSLVGSYAYSDHYSDIDILNLVDHPVAVNPNKKMYVLAAKYNWNIKNFNK